MKKKVLLLWHEERTLLGAELQDLSALLGGFEVVSEHPQTLEEHVEILERIQPDLVLLPRAPLERRPPPDRVRISAPVYARVPHKRFVYEQWGKRLAPLPDSESMRLYRLRAA